MAQKQKWTPFVRDSQENNWLNHRGCVLGSKGKTSLDSQSQIMKSPNAIVERYCVKWEQELSECTDRETVSQLWVKRGDKLRGVVGCPVLMEKLLKKLLLPLGIIITLNCWYLLLSPCYVLAIGLYVLLPFLVSYQTLYHVVFVLENLITLLERTVLRHII